MSGSTIIHMNGTDYDASGPRLKPVSHPRPVRTMDGFFNSSPSAIKARTPAPAAIRKPSRTQTLSRTAVKKPASLSGVSRPHTPTVSHISRVSPDIRLQHAQKTPLSPAVKKFNIDAVAASKPTPSPTQHAAPAHHAPVAKSRSDQLIDRQIKRAHAHTAAVYQKKPIRDRLKYMSSGRRKLLSVGASMAAVLLISGFVVYQSLPSISLSIASRRAGFTAMLPTFTPNGFSLRGPVDYAPGKVILTFNSHTNDHTYQIEQTPSGWSSETLREQVASSSGSQYQTFQMRGLTIFFTNNNSATWVDRGVLFSLKGDSGLSGDQIASIASSM